jgi:hypothetical protein
MNDRPKLRHMLVIATVIVVLVVLFFAWDSAAFGGIINEGAVANRP